MFEKIINREIPAKIIYEDDDLLAFLDISQNTKGHTLIIPKTRFTNVLDADDEIIAKINIKAKELANDLMNVFGASGVNILTNANEIAGQTVFYYHVHVIPRYTEEELEFKTQTTNFDLDKVHQAILTYYDYK